MINVFIKFNFCLSNFKSTRISLFCLDFYIYGQNVLRRVFINSSTRNVNIVENISKLHFNVGVCMTFYEKVIFIFTPLCVIKTTLDPILGSIKGREGSNLSRCKPLIE